MQDQVLGLRSKGVKAAYLSSAQSAAEQASVKASLNPDANSNKNNNMPSLLFVTPELVSTPRCGCAAILSPSCHHHSLLAFLFDDRSMYGPFVVIDFSRQQQACISTLTRIYISSPSSSLSS